MADAKQPATEIRGLVDHQLDAKPGLAKLYTADATLFFGVEPVRHEPTDVVDGLGWGAQLVGHKTSDVAITGSRDGKAACCRS